MIRSITVKKKSTFLVPFFFVLITLYVAVTKFRSKLRKEESILAWSFKEYFSLWWGRHREVHGRKSMTSHLDRSGIREAEGGILHSSVVESH